MQEKKKEICIRVSEKEKKTLQKKAEKMGLSLSSYLRNAGLKKDVDGIMKKDLYEIYVKLNELKNAFFCLENSSLLEVYTDKMIEKILKLYNEEERSEVDGDNKNMGN